MSTTLIKSAACSVKTVFHPTDFSRGDEKAFLHALRIALAIKGEISLLHVEHNRPEIDWSEFPKVTPVLTKWGLFSDAEGTAFRKKSQIKIKKIRKSGREPQEIIDFLHRHPSDLVVLATHQRGPLARLVHKAVAEPIARNSGSMTLFVPRGCKGFVSQKTGSTSLRKILIPIDLDPHPQRAIDLTIQIVSALEVPHSDIIFLHVNGKNQDAPAVNLPSQQNVNFEYVFEKGAVVDCILNASKRFEVDLIVMATQGHNGFLDALRGSTTEQVLRKTPCPLLAVPRYMS